MKKKGFTLIELLAVIMVLAIIALISTPIILKVIEKAERGSFEDSAYGILDAARLYYANMNLDKKGKEETFTFPEDNKLKLSGKKPTTGKVVLKEDGKVALAISNGKWCAKKNEDEEKIVLVDYHLEDCVVGNVVIPNTPDSCFQVSSFGDLVGYICDSKDISIPHTIDGVKITTINAYTFQNKGLTSVLLPDSLQAIGNRAFYGNQIQSIIIPEGVINIEDYAFANNKLQNVTLPKSLTSIKMGAFASNQITHIVIKEGVRIIGDDAFLRNQLVSVEFKNGLETMGTNAFAVNQLQSVTIPNSVFFIGGDAFGHNQSNMKLIINKVSGSIAGAPWGAATVEWVG